MVYIVHIELDALNNMKEIKKWYNEQLLELGDLFV